MVASAGGLGERALTIQCSASDRAVEARELRIGDRVRATRNDYRHRVLTAMIWTGASHAAFDPVALEAQHQDRLEWRQRISARVAI